MCSFTTIDLPVAFLVMLKKKKVSETNPLMVFHLPYVCFSLVKLVHFPLDKVYSNMNKSTDQCFPKCSTQGLARPSL